MHLRHGKTKRRIHVRRLHYVALDEAEFQYIGSLIGSRIIERQYGPVEQDKLIRVAHKFEVTK